MKQLILIPTDAERRLLRPLLEPGGTTAQRSIELCGFGPVAAAARAAQLIAKIEPTEVLLIGIAGSLQPAAAVGTAHRFESVACYGIGAGSGPEHRSAAEMGWAHWEDEPRIGEVLPLSCGAEQGPAATGELLTCCAASASRAEVQLRRAAFPAAVAEDMEGFAVAVSCRLAGVPLNIVRGISNHAGDREKQRWEIPAALAAAGNLARKVLSR